MKILMKHSGGALALVVAMLSVSAGAQVAPAGKPVKPPAEVVQPAPSVDIETGQIRDKGKPIPPKVEKTSDTPPPVDDAAAPPSAEWEDPKGGQHFDKGCKWPRKCNKATERRAHNGPGGTPPSTAKTGDKTGLILGITAGAAALAAILASGNNDDNPTSP